MLSSIKFILIFVVLIINCELHLPQTLNGFWHYSRFTTTWQGGHVGGQCKMMFSSQRRETFLFLVTNMATVMSHAKTTIHWALNDNWGSILASTISGQVLAFFPLVLLRIFHKLTSFLDHMSQQCSSGSSHWSPLNLLFHSVHSCTQWVFSDLGNNCDLAQDLIQKHLTI